MLRCLRGPVHQPSDLRDPHLRVSRRVFTFYHFKVFLSESPPVKFMNKSENFQDKLKSVLFVDS